MLWPDLCVQDLHTAGKGSNDETRVKWARARSGCLRSRSPVYRQGGDRGGGDGTLALVTAPSRIFSVVIAVGITLSAVTALL